MGWKRGAAVVLLAWAVACTGDVEPLTPAQREAAAAYVSKVVPSPQHALRADFGSELRLLGYDLARPEWKRGTTMRVTWHWQVLSPAKAGATLFTRISDPDSGRVLDQDGNGTLRWLYGIERWKAGEYIRDGQDLHLPADWEGLHATIEVGVETGPGTPILASPKPPAVIVPVSGRSPSAATMSLRRIGVVRTKRPPRLDGSLQDPVWSYAESTPPFVETVAGGRASVQASAKLLWDARYLYVGVDVRDSLLRASDSVHDAHLWEQDCVELMIAPDGDGRSYFEIQVSPRGIVFDTRFDGRRAPAPYGHVDWDSKARTAVQSRGGLDDEDADAGYSVEMAIPWQAFSLGARDRPAPSVGDQWRANLYVMDLGREGQQAAAWSAVGVHDFHVPRRFGILRFEEAPDDMLGTTEPIKIAPGRMGSPERRGPALDRGLRDTSGRKRAVERELESSEAGH